ncbi:hypothetical protein HC931_01510 [Candidatus Gracilibacteria bacterium]|nr:hypothetical protein [Candidatus Gracilibacteria bacterium]NJP19167.1 hypothetical protein [Hydrococcus sp. CRU_1_1]
MNMLKQNKLIFWKNTSIAQKKSNKSKSQTQKYRKFNWLFLSAALTPLLSIGLFNFVIDPYDVFNTPRLAGINQSKPKKFTHDMLFKAIEVTRIKPTVIFLGSSRVQWGLDPTYFNLPDRETAYNLGLQRANMYEVKRYFDHAIANQPNLKKVVLGIDFWMFSETIKNTPAFNEDRLEQQQISFQDALNVLFSLDAFESSQATLMDNLKNSKENLTVGSGKILIQGNVFSNGILKVDKSRKNPGSIENFTKGLTNSIAYSSPFKLSQERLQLLKSIIETCQQKGIALTIFISPSHATDMEGLHALGLWSDFEEWKREVSKIAPVWDFSGYNSITTEPIAKNMKYYLDSSHYRKETGDLILNRLLSSQDKTIPNDFGVLITPENIEAHLVKIRSDREKWLKNSPDGQLVREIKNKQTKKQTKNKSGKE